MDGGLDVWNGLGAPDGLELESIEIETPAGSVEPIDEGTTNPSIQEEI